MKSHSWNFKIDSTRALTHICLLYEVHRPYFKIGSAAFIGQTNTLNLKTGKLASEPNVRDRFLSFQIHQCNARAKV